MKCFVQGALDLPENAALIFLCQILQKEDVGCSIPESPVFLVWTAVNTLEEPNATSVITFYVVSTVQIVTFCFLERIVQPCV